ncbi:MAG TPA: DUF3857 domain-containing protein [Bacteroidia bacterium]
MTLHLLNKTLLKFLLVCAGVFGFTGSALSQNDVNVPQLFAKFPNQQLVYLLKQEQVEIKTTKGVLSVINHNTEKFLLLKNGLSNVRSKKIRTSEFVKVNNLKAHLYIYNGKKHSKKEITTIELKAEHNDDGIFYDNSQFYNITFYDAKEGDIVEIQYDEEWVEPRFFGAFYFSDYYPVLKANYSINMQNDIVLKSKEFNNQGLTYFYDSNTRDKKMISMNWKFDTIWPIIDEEYDPAFKSKASYILFSIEKYKNKEGGEVPVCGSLVNLYSWYNDLLKNVDISNDEYLVKLSDSLTNGLTDPKAKLEKIFYWVQDKVAYLAYEDGLGGYIPREALVVCKRRFGDCKDMANLITRLAQIAKLPVYRTWIGTTEIPYQFTDFPAPFCSNHMIATYINGSDTIFLDATGKYYPFGVPTSMIQGKEALIGIDKDNFTVKKVPVSDTKNNMEHDSIVLQLADGNKITGEGYYKLYGYDKIRLMHLFGNKSYKWQKEYLESVLEKGNNKFSLDTFNIVEQSLDKPLLLKYKLTINDYITESNNTKYINLNFLKDYFEKFSTSKRVHPYSFTYAGSTKLSVNFDVGKYNVEYLPEDLSFNDATFTYSLKYSKTMSKITFENSITMNKAEIDQADFPELNKAISTYRKAKSSLISISLKK